MAKFLKVGTTGFPTEESAVNTSAGAGDSGKIPELDAGGKLSSTMMPAGFGSDSTTATAAETIAAGDMIYLNASGQILKADANAIAKAAIAFAQSGITNAASGTISFEGTLTGLSGLTPGAPYFLSAATPGLITLTPPTGAADIVQPVGTAISATALSFEAGTPIIRV